MIFIAHVHSVYLDSNHIASLQILIPILLGLYRWWTDEVRSTRIIISTVLYSFGLICMKVGGGLYISEDKIIGDIPDEVEMAELREIFTGMATATDDELLMHLFTVKSIGFYLGEMIVMWTLLWNRLGTDDNPSVILMSFRDSSTCAFYILFTAISLLLPLWLRGSFWRHIILLVFEGIFAFSISLVCIYLDGYSDSMVKQSMMKIDKKIRLWEEKKRKARYAEEFQEEKMKSVHKDKEKASEAPAKIPEKEQKEETIMNITTQLQADKRKKKTFKGKKKRTRVT